MVNFSKTMLNSFIFTILGTAFTILISYFALSNLTVFWILEILVWLIIGLSIGFLQKSVQECLISSIIIGFLSFVFIFTTVLLVSLFSELILDVFTIGTIFNPERIIVFSFLMTLIFVFIIIIVLNIFSLLAFNVRRYFSENEDLSDLATLEEKYYEKYQAPESGILKKNTD